MDTQHISKKENSEQLNIHNDVYCTFCGKIIDNNELAYTEDAEPAHARCLRSTEQHWNDIGLIKLLI